MRIRTIKPEFWEDEQVQMWPIATRLCYIGLWNMADDEGRLRANSEYIRTGLFRYDSGINIDDILKPILESKKMIIYKVKGQIFGYLSNFNSHQVISKSKFSKLPPPPVKSTDTGEIQYESDMDTVRVPSGREGKGREGNREGKGCLPLDGRGTEVSDYRKFTDYFVEKWKGIYKAKNYPFHPGKDGTSAAFIWQSSGEDIAAVKSVVDRYLACKDPFITEKCHPLSMLSSLLARFIAEPTPKGGLRILEELAK